MKRSDNSTAPRCQMTMYDGEVNDHYFPCGKPAKAWIRDSMKRAGWGGRQYLCGIHERAYNKIAQRTGKPLATKI